MRTSRFTEEQIRYAVQQAEAGLPVPELPRKYGVAPATFYRWRQKYGALTKSELVRLKELERENSRLKKLVADLTLDKQILQDVLAKKTEARAPWAGSGIGIGSASAGRVGRWGGRGAVTGTGACARTRRRSGCD
jgi:putative transposase